MTNKRFYVTTAIPYVNADPHVGHALEAVQADILARHRRLRGEEVRFSSGTDDNSLKNVVAARQAGVPVAEFVNAKAARFAALADELALSYDDFIRTSSDARHGAGVERLWRACAERGDLYERDYEGLYCVGCEAFLSCDELDGNGSCREHRRPPDRIAERNWFFRLSRYGDEVRAAIEDGRLRIEPPQRRNEVLSLLRRGVEDFSVSRSAERAAGWGIPVPGDPTQVVSVWFDALANYISALDYGTAGAAYRSWWEEGDERVHVVGKGILHFHAVHWPAILLSAEAALPTAVLVHDYLTLGDEKLSKSSGGAADPGAVVVRYGRDALRWWFARDVRLAADAEFREELVAVRGNELADGLGNLVSRVLALADGRDCSPSAPTDRLAGAVDDAVDRALARFDLPAAVDAIWTVVVEANRLVAATRPWELRKLAERDASARERLDGILGQLLETIRAVAHELRPFLPDGAERIERALESGDRELARALFPKTRVPSGSSACEAGGTTLLARSERPLGRSDLAH